MLRVIRLFLAPATFLLLVGALGGCDLRELQRDFIYPGRRAAVGPRPARATGLEAHRVAISTGEVDAWYLPPFEQSGSFPALVFGHGNGELIDHWVRGLDEFRRWGMGVMLVEYPGYGKSEGTPSEATIREGMARGYDVLVSRPGVDPGRVVGYGQSLGGGAVCALARERPLAALVLQSTFTSLRPIARSFLLPSFLLVDVFDNGEVLERFDGPVLLLHGNADDLIPPAHARELAQRARDARLHLYDCGHGCWQPAALPLYRDIRAFLEEEGILAAADSR